MRDLSQVVIALLARNPNHDGHGERDNRNAREPPLPSYNNQNRPLAYDEDDNEDDEYEEGVHRGYHGLVREHACDNQEEFHGSTFFQWRCYYRRVFGLDH